MEISIYYDNAVYVCLYVTACHHLQTFWHRLEIDEKIMSRRGMHKVQSTYMDPSAY